eukprot:TRINITY_DN50596_c0_g1_i1.p1 TRINITY_DN50596_c0_g1~~TRINITY_DN50596_c0_g1_i1.p1  ORF type:complete len:202 (+),score=25.89 TRINITY_DN50596_c0_g1_i1:24-629(+)
MVSAPELLAAAASHIDQPTRQTHANEARTGARARVASSGGCSPLQGCFVIRDVATCAAAATQAVPHATFEFRGRVRVDAGQPEGCVLVEGSGEGAHPVVSFSRASGHGPQGHSGGECGAGGMNCICQCTPGAHMLSGSLRGMQDLPVFLRMWLLPAPFLGFLLLGAWFLARRQARQRAALARETAPNQGVDTSYLQLATPR